MGFIVLMSVQALISELAIKLASTSVGGQWYLQDYHRLLFSSVSLLYSIIRAKYCVHHQNFR